MISERNEACSQTGHSLSFGALKTGQGPWTMYPGEWVITLVGFSWFISYFRFWLGIGGLVQFNQKKTYAKLGALLAAINYIAPVLILISAI